jgi:hypothetical protein
VPRSREACLPQRTDERLRATLGFLEKLTLQPGELTRADAADVPAATVAVRMLAGGYRLE